MRRIAICRRPAAAVTAVVVAGALLVPATTLAAAGSLDRSFHGNGRLVIKVGRIKGGDGLEVTRLQPTPTLSAPGPKGELVVAHGQRVLCFRADGRPQKRFGGNGRATIPTPVGMGFQLAGLAVDSRGRVLIAGTTKPTGATGGSQYARVSVYRFMSNGKLDRSFGESGLAGTSLGPMNATGLAVDSHDRPVISGLSALTPSHCNTAAVYLNTTVIARLTTSGAPDPTFGGGSGLFTDPLEDPQLPKVTLGGKVVYASSPARRCAGFDGHPPAGASPVASILSPSGSLSLRIPLRPDRPNLPGLAALLEVTSLAVDRQNRIVILMTGIPPEAGGRLQVVRRLLPDGRPDPEFSEPYWEGEAGIVGIPGPPSGRFFAVATDARNRIILAGSSQRHEGRLVPHGFLAMRLNAAGKTQTWFGRDGAAKVAFGKRTDATPTQVHIDSRGRIVLSGTVVTLRPSQPPTRYSLAFTRLLSAGR
jgi:uncharacterized delta-60 repeat protein